MSFSKEFKNTVVYKVKGDVDMEILNNQDLPLWQVYEPCTETEQSTIGFLKYDPEVEGEDGLYVKSFAGLQVLRIGQSKKKVNAKEVKKLLNEQLAEREKLFLEQNPAEEYLISKDEKEDIKQEIIKSLLPKCFVEESENYLIHDKQEGMFYVINATRKVAESIADFVRVCLGSLPIHNIITEEDEESTSKKFNDFITKKLNTKLTLTDIVELKGEEGSVVWKKESLYSSEASHLIEEDCKDVQKIGLDWDGTVNFVVDNTFLITNLKFDSSILATGGSFESDVLVAMNEIRNIVNELVKELKITL